jgi:hypothetical protein
LIPDYRIERVQIFNTQGKLPKEIKYFPLPLAQTTSQLHPHDSDIIEKSTTGKFMLATSIKQQFPRKVKSNTHTTNNEQQRGGSAPPCNYKINSSPEIKTRFMTGLLCPIWPSFSA